MYLTLYIECWRKRINFIHRINKTHLKKWYSSIDEWTNFFYSLFSLTFLTWYRTFIHDTSVRMYVIVGEGKGGNFGFDRYLRRFDKDRIWFVGCMCSCWCIDDDFVSCKRILDDSACKNAICGNFSHVL